MRHRIPAIALALVVCATFAAAAFARTRPRYLPEYTASGELVLPKNFHEWIYVGSPLTPNALNDGKAGFPEYHNVYMEPGSYEIYKKTKVFPEGTILFKEIAAHTARGKRGWLAKGAFGTRVFPWRAQWRRRDRQGLEALCQQWGVGI